MNLRSKTFLGVVALIIVLVGVLWYVMHRGAGVAQVQNLATSTDAIASSTDKARATSTPVATSTHATHTGGTKTGASSGSAGSGASHPAAMPHITKFVPAAGTPGTEVTIYGSGFDRHTNYIAFGTSGGNHHPDGTPANVIAIAGSPDGTTLTFTVPASGPSGLLCDANNHCVAVTAIRLQPGTYPVTVQNAGGTSNTVSFTLMGS